MSSIKVSTCHRIISWAIMLAFITFVKPTFAGQNQEEWKTYQREFRRVCEEKGISPPALSVPQENETVAPEAGIRDLCVTCHLGVDNPLLQEAPEPFRTHPGNMLEQHPVDKFGCTVCHHGTAESLTKKEAHGRGENLSNPLIPTSHLQSSCIGCHETPYELEGAEKVEAGRLAFEKYACYACHRTAGFENLPKFAPPHRDFKKKLLDTKWIISWLRNPRAMRPGTIMPDFRLGDDEIRDLAAFLLTLKTEKEYPEVDLSAASVDKGKEFFVELGCKACHSDKKEENSFRRHVPNLADAGVKLNPGWILEELNDPKAINPDARVPKLDIEEDDALSIIAYLTTLKANSQIVAAEKLQLEGASLENGKKLVEHYGCYGCHSIEGFENAKIPSVDATETAKRKLAEISFGNAAIEKTKWDWIAAMIEKPDIFQTEGKPLKKPVYKFDEGDVENLTTFYLNNSRSELPQQYLHAPNQSRQWGQAGEWIITENNCRGCHMLEEGVKPRIEEFIGLKTYVPPRLVGEGEKVQPEWAAKYLEKSEPMRPWINIRMPVFSFSKEQIQAVLRYFSVKAESPENAVLSYKMPIRKEDIPKIERDMGEYRLLFDKCMQCHPVSIDNGLPEDVKIEDLSINLMLSKERLRFEWIKNFMRNPDKYAGAGTKMPYVYYNPDGTPRVSDAEMWIDYVAKYLMIMEKIPEAPEQEKEQAEEEIDWTDMQY